MRRFQKTTIKDVAERAGVSMTTVSLFVSGQSRVCSPSTASRIRSAIEELNYTPSARVSSVQRRATKTFGVCMFHPLNSEVEFGGRFYERLWRGIVAEADLADHSLLHFPASVRKSGRTDAFLDGRIDGVLYHANTNAAPNARPLRLALAGIPTVLLTRSRNLPDGCGAVYTDESTATSLALEHLWGLGHRRIAHLAGPVVPDLTTQPPALVGDIAQGRLDSYRSFLEVRDAYDPALVGLNGSWTPRRVEEILAGWIALRHRPTAVFCANDTLALATIAAARRRGWRVPEDLSVVGVDDTAASEGLTSVEIDEIGIGRESVRTLLRLIAGAPLEECRLALPALRLHVRGTSARPASGL